MVAGASLSAAELDQLQSELVAQMESAGSMPLDVAHGFLTATAILSGQAERLIDRVLGGLAADAELRDLISRFRAQLLADLVGGDYGPLILQLPREDGSTLPLPYGWCQGYVAGIDQLAAGARDRLLADPQASALLAPVFSFLMYERAQWFDPPDEAAHRETVGELGEAAVDLYRWCLDHPEDGSTPIGA